MLVEKRSKETLPIPAEMFETIKQDWRKCERCGRSFNLEEEGQSTNHYNRDDLCMFCED